MKNLQFPCLAVCSAEFGDGLGAGASSSSKVDRLGAVLKSGVSRLRGRAEADLVFLVDSSASVGADNFRNEIKFVRKVSESVRRINKTRLQSSHESDCSCWRTSRSR